MIKSPVTHFVYRSVERVRSCCGKSFARSSQKTGKHGECGVLEQKKTTTSEKVFKPIRRDLKRKRTADTRAKKSTPGHIVNLQDFENFIVIYCSLLHWIGLSVAACWMCVFYIFRLIKFL